MYLCVFYGHFLVSLLHSCIGSISNVILFAVILSWYILFHPSESCIGPSPGIGRLLKPFCICYKMTGVPPCWYVKKFKKEITTVPNLRYNSINKLDYTTKTIFDKISGGLLCNTMWCCFMGWKRKMVLTFQLYQTKAFTELYKGEDGGGSDGSLQNPLIVSQGKAAKEAEGRLTKSKGLMEINWCHWCLINMSVQCVTTPVWRQWL